MNNGDHQGSYWWLARLRTGNEPVPRRRERQHGSLTKLLLEMVFSDLGFGVAETWFTVGNE